MITLVLTAEQAEYLRRALSRDSETLEEMAPWYIDSGAEHARELEINGQLTKAMEVTT